MRIEYENVLRGEALTRVYYPNEKIYADRKEAERFYKNALENMIKAERRKHYSGPFSNLMRRISKKKLPSMYEVPAESEGGLERARKSLLQEYEDIAENKTPKGMLAVGLAGMPILVAYTFPLSFVSMEAAAFSVFLGNMAGFCGICYLIGRGINSRHKKRVLQNLAIKENVRRK